MIDIDLFRNLIAEREFKQLRQIVNTLDVVDLAEIIADLEEEREFIIAFRLLRRSERPLVFANLPADSQEKLLTIFPDIISSAFVEEMNPDDRTRLLESVSSEIAEQLIAKLSPDEQRIARMLLSYPTDSVGRLMTTDFVVVKDILDVASALGQVRWVAAGLDKNLLYNILVTDDCGVYRGSISLPELVTQDPTSTLIGDMLPGDYLTLQADDDRELAVDNFRKYDCDFLPVVDNEGKLQGIVTADDVFDVAEEEATEDMHQFGGQEGLDTDYFNTPIATMIRKRAGWLAILFVGELFTGGALKFYDAFIVQMGFIIYFLPLVISTGGNSGTQSAALIIRGLAIKEMHLRDWFKIFRRELLIGICLGALLGVMGYLRSTTWDYSWKISLVIFLTIMSVVIFGALLGSMLPFLFKKIKLDPAVVSSPFIASLVDLFGVIVLINIARFLLM